jgi:hypothetical protein
MSARGKHQHVLCFPPAVLAGSNKRGSQSLQLRQGGPKARSTGQSAGAAAAIHLLHALVLITSGAAVPGAACSEILCVHRLIVILEGNKVLCGKHTGQHIE